MSTPPEQAQMEAELRQAMAAGEQLQGQLGSIEEQLGYLAQLVSELTRGRTTLEALGKAKRGEEVLLPVGGGNFVRATLAEPDKVLSGIGSDLTVEGPLDDALRRLDQQLEQARGAMQQLQEEGQRVVEQMRALDAHVGRLTG